MSEGPAAGNTGRNRRTCGALTNEQLTNEHSLEDPMRKILLAFAATAILAAPFATAVKAEDTTVIKRDGDSKTVIKKEESEPKILPVPHEEHKTTVIKKEHD